jgi:hypothetical protein
VNTGGAESVTEVEARYPVISIHVGEHTQIVRVSNFGGIIDGT